MTRWWPKWVWATMDCCCRRRSNSERWKRSRRDRAMRLSPGVIHPLLARSRPSPPNLPTCRSPPWRRERPEFRAGQPASIPLRRLIIELKSNRVQPTPNTTPNKIYQSREQSLAVGSSCLLSRRPPPSCSVIKWLNRKKRNITTVVCV